MEIRKTDFSKLFTSSRQSIIVFFQFAESGHSDPESTYIERVVWAIDDRENGISDFKRFCTAYYVGNAIELLYQIRKRLL